MGGSPTNACPHTAGWVPGTTTGHPSALHGWAETVRNVSTKGVMAMGSVRARVVVVGVVMVLDVAVVVDTVVDVAVVDVVGARVGCAVGTAVGWSVGLSVG